MPFFKKMITVNINLPIFLKLCQPLVWSYCPYYCVDVSKITSPGESAGTCCMVGTTAVESSQATTVQSLSVLFTVVEL